MSEQKEPQITAFDFLQGFPGAPSRTQIDEWKAQAPGHRVRLFHSSDGKRVYLLRGIAAQELRKIQSALPANIVPELAGEEVQRRVVIKCCVWTSASTDNKLNEIVLDGSGAGLAQTLHEIIAQISDYTDPVDIQRYSADL